MRQRRLILCRSQSEAMIFSRRLTACGVDTTLVRPPRSSNVRACSWAVAVPAASAEQAEACLNRADIPSDIWRWEDGGV